MDAGQNGSMSFTSPRFATSKRLREPLSRGPKTLLPEQLARQLRAGQLRTGRELVAEREANTGFNRCAPFTTALSGIDHLLGKGLLRGETVELIGHRSSGRFSIALSTLAAATQQGESVALVDLGDHLDPQAAETAGVSLDRLLWLRPCHMKQALAAAEVVISSGFPLVVVDLGAPPVPGGRGAEASWLRLARAAQTYESALLVLSPYRVSGTAARTVIEVGRGRGLWAAPLRGRGSPQLLGGLKAQARLEKARNLSVIPRDRPTLHRPPRQGVPSMKSEKGAAGEHSRQGVPSRFLFDRVDIDLKVRPSSLAEPLNGPHTDRCPHEEPSQSTRGHQDHSPEAMATGA